MALTLDQLLTSPDHYLHSIEGDDAVFVPMDRAAYQRSIFLDGRISPAADGAARVPLSALIQAGGHPEPLGWIFHMAHCGSTLLARALDALSAGANIVLREPLALRQLGFEPDPDRLATVLTSLAKRYPGGGPTLIKANVPVNFLLPEIVDRDPSAPAIFLAMSLPDYLLAILRSDNHRAWLRGIVGQFAVDLGVKSPLSDAETGAALWLGMMRRFSAALSRMPNARMLDAETFFARPDAALLAAAAHFGIATDPDEVTRIVGGALFATYSKRPDQAFNNARRLERREALANQLAGEIAAAQAWLGQAAPDEDLLLSQASLG